MIVLLDTSEDLDVAADELQLPVEQLFTPLTRFTNRRPESKFAIDNGAFSKFDAKGFLSLLEREKERRENCRFVTVPDVVGSARRTLEVFDYWFPLLGGWPLAFACQDGQEHLPIPWEFIDAVFIGGSTPWKTSMYSVQIIKAAQAMGKWVHVGRVNTPERYQFCLENKVDSIDGSGIARFSHMRIALTSPMPPRLWDNAQSLGLG